MANINDNSNRLRSWRFGLRTLLLGGTRVTDVSPLARSTSLRELNVACLTVDLAPLKRLNNVTIILGGRCKVVVPEELESQVRYSTGYSQIGRRTGSTDPRRGIASMLSSTRIQKLLGHVHLETTTIYVKVAKPQDDSAVPSPLDNLYRKPTASQPSRPVGSRNYIFNRNRQRPANAH